MKEFNITTISGDGVGPEIMAGALAVLNATGVKFNFTEADAGGVSIDRHGVPLTEENLNKCKTADSVLLAAVGGPKWDNLPGHLRPERALLAVRRELGLFANIRPARLYPALKDACPLKNVAAFDFVVVRELTGGMYYGERGRRKGAGGEEAFDTECYSEKEIERIAKVAFGLASKRAGRVVSIDKANVLESSRLWRETVHRVALDFDNILITDMLVDNAAMQLVKNPAQFDVILTSNMFGDILSDEAAQITGSIGMLPSASLGAGSLGLYEPIHGSAPDIAGRDVVNPIATILSAAMMCKMSLNLGEEAAQIEKAVQLALDAGFRTADIAGKTDKPIGCKAMTAEILKRM